MSNTDAGYEVITDRVVALLNAGTVPWHKPWSEAAGGAGAPRSVKGHVYRGINVFMLAAQGYSNPYWLTFHQALELGGSVKAGQHGTPVTFWKTLTIKPKPGEDQKAKPKVIPLLRYYTVFNLDQTEGCKLPAKVAASLVQTEPRLIVPSIDTAEAIVAAMPNPPTIRWGTGNGQAYYLPFLDEINLPARDSFVSPEAAYDTLFHEIGHATGHKSRLDRFEAASFGSHTYGREELVAEMTSAFLCGECGILPAVIDNNAAYLASWTRTIKEDTKAVVWAAGRAQKAADYILGRQAAYEEEAAA